MVVVAVPGWGEACISVALTSISQTQRFPQTKSWVGWGQRVQAEAGAVCLAGWQGQQASAHTVVPAIALLLNQGEMEGLVGLGLAAAREDPAAAVIQQGGKVAAVL